MRRAGLSGLCLAGAFFVIGVASASAAPPEFGRCVKVAVGTGVYATGNCTSEGGEKKYEWFPGPGPNAGFTGHGGLAVRGATTKAQWDCSSGTVEGQITGTKTVGVTLRFTGCVTGVPCGSEPLDEVVIPGSGELGVIKAGETPLKDKIGLTLAGETSFECGGGVVKIHLYGSAIGTFSPTHSMTTLRKWTFKVKGVAPNEKQWPEEFEGGLPQTFEQSVNFQPPEKALITMPLELTFAEKIEVNTVV